MREDARAPVAPPVRPGRILVGGVVAHNEERALARAVRSLLDQELPEGCRWGSVWIVASGCTDRTVAVAERLANEDARIRVLVEAERRGKAHAVCEVLRRAEGDLLVLLNGDASAEPGAVRALVDGAERVPAPFAVMGRPIPRDAESTPLDRMIRLLWSIHHELNLELDQPGAGAHLSDELLLLSLPPPPALHDGIINDGAFLGVWLTLHHGGVVYAPRAEVRIEVPTSLRDHLSQRRRILVGHRQVTSELGESPRTLTNLALTEPVRALRLLARSLRDGGHRRSDLARLAAVELASILLAFWDSLPPRKDHVRWTRIASGEESGSPAFGNSDVEVGSPRVPTAQNLVDRRLLSLLEIADRYGTGIDANELTSLLPEDGPAHPEELRQWLERRPELGRLEGDRVFSRATPARGLIERRDRGVQYYRAATELVGQHLAPVLPWVRCVGITGSAAYGEPEAGDDLDFFVVTRSGSLWVFLTYAYLAVRLRFRPSDGSERPLPCFNFVLDEPTAAREFARARGFLFAREALTARVLHGHGYYGRLLAAAPWIGTEIPRLYRERRASAPPAPSAPAPWPVRVLNTALFVPVAAYLQLVGIRRNSRIRKEGPVGDTFQTRTSLRRLAFASARFERLRDGLALATARPPTKASTLNAPPAWIPQADLLGTPPAVRSPPSGLGPGSRPARSVPLGAAPGFSTSNSPLLPPGPEVAGEGGRP